MKNSDLMARIAAGVEIMAVLFNLVLAFIWFISFVLLLVGIAWGLVALVALVEGALALFVVFKGYSPVGIVGPLLGIGVSICNFNFFGGMIEMVVLMLMIGALVVRNNEIAAEEAA
ncbi:MAG: hypothetical protein KC621_19360 [Myxococcales bacterium]|nr:hypothetical protein [Myxococcales bacterium]